MHDRDRPLRHAPFVPILAFAAICLAALAGCESIPDAVNPWADEKKAESGSAVDTSKVPGQDAPFPNLASVPDRPKPVLSAKQRADVVDGLVADRDNAVYSDGSGPGSAKPGTVKPAPRDPVKELSIGPPLGAGARRVASIVFAVDSVELPPAAVELLRKAAQAQQGRGGKLQVVGYADGPGDKKLDARMRLAAGRSQAVAIALMRLGVARDSIRTSANAGGTGKKGRAGRADVYLSR